MSIDASLVDFQPILRIIESLDRVSETKTRYGEFVKSGYLNNLRVSASNRGLTVKGSIHKFWHGQNYGQFKLTEVKNALESIQDELHVNLMGSMINRVDAGVNMEVTQDPKLYFYSLGQSNHYIRQVINGTTLSFRNSHREISFYDKFKQVSKDRSVPNMPLTSKNTIRFELRMIRGVAKQLCYKNLTAFDLCQTCIQQLIIDKCLKEFKAIRKVNQISADLNLIRKPQDYFELLISRLIDLEGIDRICEEVDYLRKSSILGSQEYGSRIKKKIYGLAEKYQSTAIHSLHNELVEKFVDGWNKLK